MTYDNDRGLKCNGSQTSTTKHNNNNNNNNNVAMSPLPANEKQPNQATGQGNMVMMNQGGGSQV